VGATGPTGPNGPINDLSDVTITSASSGQVLQYNGSVWVNAALIGGATISATAPSSPSAGNLWLDSVNADLYIYYDSHWVQLTGEEPVVEDFNDLADVDVPSPTSGQFLKYDGTYWVNDSIDLGTDTTGNYMSDVTAGTGVTITHTPGEGSNATIAIGQAVATNSNVQFNDVTVSGNLTVSGTTTSINTETLTVNDNIVVLNNNVTGAPTEDAGIEVERGSSTNVQIRWNETTDKWQFTNDGTNYSDFGSGGALISATPPSAPEAGMLWFDSDTGQTFVYYDSSWIEIGGSTNGAIMQVNSNAPTSPTEGTMWFDSDTAQTFVYYDGQWVEIGASAMAATVSDTAPNGPIAGQLWFESDTGATYVYYNSTWVEVGATAVDQVLNAIDAKGDLLVGTADDTLDNLTVGTNGNLLVADSSTTTGLKWESPVKASKSVAMAIVFGGG
jgi:hypothetical protein